MNPKVSIIVPCYNVELYIEKCICSILENKYEPKEIILIDDGSIDNTFTILKRFVRYSGVKVISQKNSGVSACRNRGLEEADGKYIFFLDSDDWISPDCIEKLVEEAEQSQADFILGGICVAVEESDGSTKYEQKQIPHVRCKNQSEIFSIVVADLVGLSDQDIYRWNHSGKLQRDGKLDGYACGRLYRKAIIDKYQIRYDTNLYMKEDTIFNLEYLAHSFTTSFVNVHLYFYRIRRDRSNVVARLDEDIERIYRNKLGLLRARSKIRKINQEYNKVDILDMYCGSIVLSAIEVALCCTSNKKLGRRGFKEYMRSGVYDSVNSLKLEMTNLKFNIVLLILKLHADDLFYFMVNILTLVGLDKKLKNI